MEIEYPSVNGGRSLDKTLLEILVNNDQVNKVYADAVTRGYLYSSIIAGATTKTIHTVAATTLLDFDFLIHEPRAFLVKLFAQVSYANNTSLRTTYTLTVDGSVVKTWYSDLYNGYAGGNWFKNDGYFTHVIPSLAAGEHTILIQATNSVAVFSPASNAYVDITIEDFGAGVVPL